MTRQQAGVSALTETLEAHEYRNGGCSCGKFVLPSYSDSDIKKFEQSKPGSDIRWYFWMMHLQGALLATAPPEQRTICQICGEYSYDCKGHAAPPEQAVQVAGRMEQTFSEHTRRLGLLIAEEQEKPLPNNTLIAALCDSIRLAREAIAVIADQPQAASGGALDDLISRCDELRLNRRRYGNLKWEAETGHLLARCAEAMRGLAAHDQKVRRESACFALGLSAEDKEKE